MVTGVIFDMDGTITLTEPLHYRAFAAVFEKLGIKYDFETHVRRFAGAGSEKTFLTILSESGRCPTEDEVIKWARDKHELYKKIVQENEIKVVPGAPEFIYSLRQAGMPIAMATGNSDLEIVRVILSRIGLGEAFSEIVSISQVARGKPHPDVFLEAARRIDSPPPSTLVFEDAINGTVSAVAAGMRVVAVETTTEKNDLLAAGASLVVRDYTQLPSDLLSQM